MEDGKEGSREFTWETDNSGEMRRPRPMLGEVVRSGHVLDVSRQNQQDLQTHWMWNVKKKKIKVRMDSESLGGDLKGWAGCYWGGRL